MCQPIPRNLGSRTPNGESSRTPGFLGLRASVVNPELAGNTQIMRCPSKYVDTTT